MAEINITKEAFEKIRDEKISEMEKNFANPAFRALADQMMKHFGGKVEDLEEEFEDMKKKIYNK